MDHCCQCVIVEHGQRDLGYSGAAETIASDLVWGPGWTLELIRGLLDKADHPSNWLDETTCGGAVLVDLDQKVLLFFGGDIKYDVPRRRAFLDLLQVQWPGWTVRWAHEGIVEVAEYAGYAAARDRLAPIAGLDYPDFDVRLLIGGQDGPFGWVESVASVRWSNGRLGIYPMINHAQQLALTGLRLPRFLKRRDFWQRFWRRPGFDSARLDVGLCSGGVHIDVRAQEVGFWLSEPYGDALKQVSDRWPKWTVTWHGTAFEKQAAATGGPLVFVSKAQDVLKREILESLEQSRPEAPTERYGVPVPLELRAEVLGRLKRSLDEGRG